MWLKSKCILSFSSILTKGTERIVLKVDHKRERQWENSSHSNFFSVYL